MIYFSYEASQGLPMKEPAMTATPLPAKFAQYVTDDVEWQEKAMGRARTAMVEAATDETKLADYLYDRAVTIAKYEAHLGLAYAVQRYTSHESCTVELVRDHLMEVLLAGADDEWSGRGNDLRRVVFDVKRRVVREYLQVLARS